MKAYKTQQAAIAITDATGKIIFCNTVFSQLSGRNRESIYGTFIIDFLAEYSERFLDEHFCNDLFAHDNSCTSLILEWPGDSSSRYMISHSIFDSSNDKSNKIFTFSAVECSDPYLQNNQRQRPEPQDSIDRQKEHLETTQSLIETNVELRKEIRNHQKALKELRESESRFRNLTETTSDFIWEIDRSGKYTYVSPKSQELLGFSPDELLHTTSLLFRDFSNIAQFIKKIENSDAETKGFQNRDYLINHKNGNEVVMESSGEPIFNNAHHLVGFRGIDRDITERIQYQRKLKLAKRVTEQANEAKSEFLANMSHELRTPLHAILCYSRYGEKRIETAARKHLYHYFHQIGISTNRLFPLIDSLLDLSKIEAGTMHYSMSHQDLRHELEAAIAELRHLALEKYISIALRSPDFIPAACYDRDRISQVIRNILSNAITFSEENTEIEISFSLEKSSNGTDHIKTTITNQGIGIPEAELETIFDKFVQSSKTRTGAGGTGLGLFICRKIIDDMHGSIWAENTEDKRTGFHFTLPATPATERIRQILLQKGLVSREDLEIALHQQQINT